MRVLIVVFSIGAFVSGCSLLQEKPTPVPEKKEPITVIVEETPKITEATLKVSIIARQNINPNLEGIASPVELKLFQLKENTAFDQAEFLSLYTNEQAILKTAMISSHDLSGIFPNEKSKVTFSLHPDTKYLAVVAGFSNFYDAKNKAIYKLDGLINTEVTIFIDGINVGITTLSQDFLVKRNEDYQPINIWE